MHRPYDNLFTFYRGPAARNATSAAVGKQLEDNATKGLLNLIELADTGRVASPVVSAIAAAIPALDSAGDLSTTDDITVRTQVRPADVPCTDRLVSLYGLVGEDAEPLDPLAETDTPLHISDGANTDESDRRLDAVIELGDNHVIVGEHKFHSASLSTTEIRRYATLLKVPPEQYGVLTWLDMYRALGSVTPADGDTLTATLVDQYREFLEYWQLSFEVSTSRFDDGYN